MLSNTHTHIRITLHLWQMYSYSPVKYIEIFTCEILSDEMKMITIALYTSCCRVGQCNSTVESWHQSLMAADDTSRASDECCQCHRILGGCDQCDCGTAGYQLWWAMTQQHRQSPHCHTSTVGRLKCGEQGCTGLAPPATSTGDTRKAGTRDEAGSAHQRSYGSNVSRVQQSVTTLIPNFLLTTYTLDTYILLLT